MADSEAVPAEPGIFSELEAVLEKAESSPAERAASYQALAGCVCVCVCV